MAIITSCTAVKQKLYTSVGGVAVIRSSSHNLLLDKHCVRSSRWSNQIWSLHPLHATWATAFHQCRGPLLSNTIISYLSYRPQMVVLPPFTCNKLFTLVIGETNRAIPCNVGYKTQLRTLCQFQNIQKGYKLYFHTLLSPWGKIKVNGRCNVNDQWSNPTSCRVNPN